MILFLACINYSECIPLHLSPMEPGCSVSVELSPSNSCSICLSLAPSLCLAIHTSFKHTHKHTVDKICLYLIAEEPWQALSGILIMTPLCGGPSMQLWHRTDRAKTLLGWINWDFCSALRTLSSLCCPDHMADNPFLEGTISQ